MNVEPIIYDDYRNIIVGHYLNRDYLTIYINNNYGSSAAISKKEIMDVISDFLLELFGESSFYIKKSLKNHLKLLIDSENRLKYYEKYSSYNVEFFGRGRNKKLDHLKYFYGCIHGIQKKYISSIFYRDYEMLNHNMSMRVLYDLHIFLNEPMKYSEFVRL
jgi:hypothetical protein